MFCIITEKDLYLTYLITSSECKRYPEKLEIILKKI